MTTKSTYLTTADLCGMLKDAARSRGVSPRELSERSGIPLGTLQRKLNDKSRLLMVDLLVIADGLGIDSVELIEEAEARAAALSTSTSLSLVGREL